MWMWSCPKGPKLPDSDKPAVVYRHHSEKSANEMLVAHVMGSDLLGVSPCFADHKLADDGKPCAVPNCRFKYIPAQEDVV